MKLLNYLLFSLILLSEIVCAEQESLFSNTDFGTLLEKHDLPGVSIAVVNNYDIVYAEAFGEKEVGSQLINDTETVFGAASISKAITAVIVAQLAEQKLLDLDTPVIQYLKRWHLPESEFTANKPITLRHLLTHTAGINQSGFSAYFKGDDVPTLIESLNGKKLKKPEDPITILSSPGTRFKYSGGGFVIAQMVIEEVVGKPFNKVAQKTLFEPLEMTNSSFLQHGYPVFPSNVAKAHDEDGSLTGGNGLPFYPQSAAAGLWTTPTDIAKLVIALQKALDGNAGEVISPWVAVETTRIQTLQKAGGWGLGWMRYMAHGNLEWFSHSGYGAGFGGQVMATMQGGKAIIVFGNGPHKTRVPLINEVINTVIQDLEWSNDIAVSQEQCKKHGSAKIIGHFFNNNRGFFSPFNEIVTVYEKGDELLLDNSFGTRPAYVMHQNRCERFRINEFVTAEIGLHNNDIAFFHSDLERAESALIRLDNGLLPPYIVAREKGYAAALESYKNWQLNYPDTLLTRVGVFNRLVASAKSAGRYQEAMVFYRLALYFHPEDEELLEGLKTLKAENDFDD